MTDRKIPIFFIGPRRSGTTAVYDCLYSRNKKFMSRVKETFVFSSYNPEFDKWVESRDCTVGEIIDFCPGVHGSPLSYVNLKLFSVKYNVRPVLIVIHRDKYKALESCINYFTKRHVLKSNREELAVDSAFQQYYQGEISDAMARDFEVLEFQFKDVMKDGLGSLGEYLTSVGVDFDASLGKRNSQEVQFRSGALAMMILSSYRAIRKYLPDRLFDYLQSSKLAKRLIVGNGPDDKTESDRIYTEKVIEILTAVGARRITETEEK